MVRKQEQRIGAQLVAKSAARGRPPGKCCLTVLGEIALAHRAGRLWFPRDLENQGAQRVLQRAAYALRLVRVYRLVIGDVSAGYRLARCPLCGVATCHGSSCQADKALAA